MTADFGWSKWEDGVYDSEKDLGKELALKLAITRNTNTLVTMWQMVFQVLDIR